MVYLDRLVVGVAGDGDDVMERVEVDAVSGVCEAEVAVAVDEVACGGWGGGWGAYGGFL